MSIEVNLNASMDSVERFGKYLLLQPIRKGGMSVLHLALNTVDGRVVVLKRVRSDKASDLLARFRDEIATSFQLHHGNLVRAIETGTIGDVTFLALEWIQGQDLTVLIDRAGRFDQPPSLAVVGAIVLAVLDGLAAAHKVSGFVHRDVKPDNIMLGYDGEVKLLDFGIALSAFKSARTIPGMQMGSIGSMSPEQKDGKPVDARSDLFSLATVLYFLLTGVSTDKPEDGHSKEHLRTRLAGKDVPEPVLTVLWRALQGNPNNRYGSAAEMAAALRGALSGVASTSDLALFIGGLFALEKQRVLECAAEWQSLFDGAQRWQDPRAMTLPHVWPRRIMLTLGVAALIATVMVTWKIKQPLPAARPRLTAFKSNPTTKLTLAQIELDAGNYAKAVGIASQAAREFRQVLATNPADAEAQQGLLRAERLLSSHKRDSVPE